MSGLHECQLYVSARRSLRIYNALSLSLSSLTECVCLCGPKSCFFPTSLSPLFCVDLVVDKAAPAQISKNKKKREIALFLSLSRSLFHEKALFEVRDAFSLLLEIVESKKKSGKIQNLRAERFHQTRALAHAGRERKKDVRFRTNRTFFFFAVRFVFVFRAREKERKKLCAEDWERERATVRYLYQLLTHTSKREIKK